MTNFQIIPGAEPSGLPARWLMAIAAAVLLAEVGFWSYRWLGWRPAEGAVYSWPEALNRPPASPKDLEAAMHLFQADRGGHPAIPLAPQGRLVAYYLEWDALKSAITTPAGGHRPEVCNTALGYEFKGALEPRSWNGPAGPIEFEVTEFTSPSGQPVFVFKNIWFRGLGNWENRAIVSPWERLGILARHRLEEVRILTVGIFGLPSPDAAWKALADHVLTQLEWRGIPTTTPPQAAASPASSNAPFAVQNHPARNFA